MADPRAYERLTREHLDRLAAIAARDRDGLFVRRPRLTVYRERVVAVALCQGGALHYLDGRNGVKDLDVWTLYAAHPDSAYPHRRVGTALFGPSELSGWGGRVDLLGRSLDLRTGQGPIAAWRGYLSEPRTGSARALARKPVVMLEPAELRGQVVWPA